jgi:Tfp pilus assembly ATPase PilU
MITMNASLLDLVTKGCISEKEALESSNDCNELEKMFRGAYQGTKAYYE